MRFFLSTDIEMLFKNMKKYKWKNMFYFELSGKQTVDIFGIAVSIWIKHEFETMVTSNDMYNIQDGIGKGIGSKKRAY